MIVLCKPLLNGYSSRDGPMTNVYPGLLKQNRTFRRNKGYTTKYGKDPPSRQFVDGTRNLWRQGQCWMQ